MAFLWLIKTQLQIGKTLIGSPFFIYLFYGIFSNHLDYIYGYTFMTLQRLILERIPTVKEVAKYSINALLFGHIWNLVIISFSPKVANKYRNTKDADWDDKLIRKYLPAIVVIVVSGGWFFFLVIQLILQL